MVKIVETIDPKTKIVFAQMQREPRHKVCRRRHTTPITFRPLSLIPQRCQHRANTLGAPILYCYCHMPDDGSLMIRYTKRACAVKWYHVRCIEKNVDLRGKWYCQTCRS